MNGATIIISVQLDVSIYKWRLYQYYCTLLVQSPCIWQVYNYRETLQIPSK